MGGDQREQTQIGRRLVLVLLACFLGANLYFMWFSDIIQDISEGFSSCEKPVIVLFEGKNASELPLSSEEALLQWNSFPEDQPKLLGNRREGKGFVSILIPVTDMENKTRIGDLNATLQSLVAHTRTKDQLDMSVFLIIYSGNSSQDKLQWSRKAVRSLIEENIYFINIGFLTIIQIPIPVAVHDFRPVEDNQSVRNNKVVPDFNNNEVSMTHFPALFPHLKEANTYVTFLCPGFVAETRILPVMHQHLAEVMKSNLGPHKVPVENRWTVLDFAREDPSCPLAGRFLRVQHLKEIYEYLQLFPTLRTLSNAMRGFQQIKSQYNAYLLDPVLFINQYTTSYLS